MGRDLMTGNRAILKMKGEEVGFAQNVTASDDHGLQPVGGLGEPETQELVTGNVTHTISCSKFWIYNRKLNAIGVVPIKGQYLEGIEIDIEIIDESSGEVLEHYSGCKFASGSRTYAAHQVTGEDATFRALSKLK